MTGKLHALFKFRKDTTFHFCLFALFRFQCILSYIKIGRSNGLQLQDPHLWKEQSKKLPISSWFKVAIIQIHINYFMGHIFCCDRASPCCLFTFIYQQQSTSSILFTNDMFDRSLCKEISLSISVTHYSVKKITDPFCNYRYIRYQNDLISVAEIIGSIQSKYLH